MSSRRQRSIPLGGRYRQVSLYNQCNFAAARYVWTNDTPHKPVFGYPLQINFSLLSRSVLMQLPSAQEAYSHTAHAQPSTILKSEDPSTRFYLGLLLDNHSILCGISISLTGHYTIYSNHCVPSQKIYYLNINGPRVVYLHNKYII